MVIGGDEIILNEGEFLPIETALRAEFKESPLYEDYVEDLAEDEDFDTVYPLAFRGPDAICRIAAACAYDLNAIPSAESNTGTLVKLAQPVVVAR